MSDTFYTMAVVTAKDSRIDDLKSVLATLTEETRKEAGAIEYLFVHDQKDPNTFISYEKWANAEEESKRWHTPHLESAIEQLNDILVGNPIIYKGSQIT
jgi:quinol monooxygenase YgiN